MFDWIKVDYLLPDFPTDIPRDAFQTKSLGSFLEVYTITENGRLTKENDAGRIVDIYYHGTISFYTWWQEIWYQYKAEFDDGQLVKIEREVTNLYYSQYL